GIGSSLRRARNARRSRPRPSGRTKREQSRSEGPVGRGGRKRNRLGEILVRPPQGGRTLFQALATATCKLVERDGARHRHVERLGSARLRDRNSRAAAAEDPG